MHKSIQPNRRLYLTQDLQNLYPLESRARQNKYSVTAQVFNVFALDLLRHQIEIERSLDNYVPALIDTEEVDVIYRAPNILGTNGTTYPKFYDGTSTSYSEVIKVDPDLDSFWYSVLPTRLEAISTSKRTIHEEKTGTIYLSTENYSYSSLNNLVSTSTENLSLTNGGSSWSAPILYFYATSGTEVIVSLEGSATSSDPVLLFEWYDNVLNTSIERKEIKYGIRGVSTTISTQTSINHLINQKHFFFYDAIGETGLPFVDIHYFGSTESSTDNLIRNWSIKDFYQMQNLDTSSKFNRSFTQEKPNNAFVKVRNGSSLSIPNLYQNNVAGVIIKGIDELGKRNAELVLTPFNGVHQSLKRWYGIQEFEPYYLPSGCSVDIELQNFQKDMPVADTVQSYSNPQVKNVLFRNISTSSATSFLENYTPFANDLNLSNTEEHLLMSKIELRDQTGAAFQAIDAAYDFLNQLVYVLDNNSKVHLFDLFNHWPSQSSLVGLQLRTPNPKHFIELENFEDELPAFGETKTVSHYWADRSVVLQRHRWILHKPDGTVVGIDENNTEVAITTDFWITNTEAFDIRQNEYRFRQRSVPITFNQYGDFILVLESEFISEEDSSISKERDVVLFSVFKKEALKTFEIQSALGTPIGIDFAKNKDLVIAYSDSNNPYSVFEEYRRLRYDYYYVSENNRELIFRENYGNIYLILESGDGIVCQKTVLNKTNNDALSASQIDCYFVVANSSSGALSFSLPEISNSLNGKTVVIKRYGANSVQVNPNAADTIDGASSLSLVSNYDSYTLTAVYSLNMWMIS